MTPRLRALLTGCIGTLAISTDGKREDFLNRDVTCKPQFYPHLTSNH